MGKFYGYPLVNIQKAIEHGPVEIVCFPINSMGGSFHGKMLVHQRVYPIKPHLTPLNHHFPMVSYMLVHQAG